MAYIQCEDLVLGYEGTSVAEHISFSVEMGDYLCIVGENGAGKSTLFQLNYEISGQNDSRRY